MVGTNDRDVLLFTRQRRFDLSLNVIMLRLPWSLQA